MKIKKIKLSKSQWEKIGNECGWKKTAQNVAPAQGQQPAPAPAQSQQNPAWSKGLRIIEQSLGQLEMQASQLPMNGSKIRALVSQIRALAKSEPEFNA